MVGGVPIGEPAFVLEVLRRKADEIVSYIDTTMSSLRDHPHSAWASVFYCCTSRFDHWLRHLPPYQTAPASERIDERLMEAAEQLSYEGLLDDDITRERFGLAARMRGCGTRSRRRLAPMAYVSCCVEACERIADEARPLFPALVQCFGAGAFRAG